jgi:hypothetical protein
LFQATIRFTVQRFTVDELVKSLERKCFFLLTTPLTGEPDLFLGGGRWRVRKVFEHKLIK